MVVEGVAGVFFYHIGLTDKPSRSLCGKETMPTRIPLGQYNSAAGHLDEKWCQDCLNVVIKDPKENVVFQAIADILKNIKSTKDRVIKS